MANFDEIERRFTYQPPTYDTRPVHERINELTKALAHAFDELLPDGREKACALTAVQEARMWANAAIATAPSQ